MTDEMNGLRTKQSLVESPIYKGGNSMQMIREKYGLDEVVKLASNENPLPTSAKVVAALQEAMSDLNRYPPAGDDALCEALAASVGRGMVPDNFVTGNSGCDVLRMIADSYVTAEDEVIICPPAFLVYELTTKRIGATLVKVPLLEPDFSYDVQGILAAVTERTRVIYLCSPNNPTGNVLTQQQLDDIMAGVPDHVLVVADEVYHQFNTQADYADSFKYVQEGRNIIVLHSFSKVFGLAGLRLGYGVAPLHVAQYLARARLPFHINNLTYVAALAGLQDDDHIQNTVEVTLDGRARLYQGLLAQEGVDAWPTEANFVLFKPSKIDASELAEKLQAKGTIVRDLKGFFFPGYLRVSAGLPAENEQFLQHLSEVLRMGSN